MLPATNNTYTCCVLITDVEVDESFAYLGTQISKDGSCEAEISRHIAITRDCVRALQRHIWRSSIAVATKVRLLNAYALPVLLYVAETWSLTAAFDKKLDAVHQWCLRRLLRLTYLRHVMWRYSPNTPGAAPRPCGTGVTFLVVISRGPTAEWIIHVLFDPLFLDCHAIGNDLPVDHDELGFVYD